MASTPRRMHTLTLLSDPAVTISVGNPTSSQEVNRFLKSHFEQILTNARALATGS